MQQKNQQERHFSDSQQQPVYRFPQNYPSQDWQRQQSFDSSVRPVSDEEAPLSRREVRQLNRVLHKRRKIFTLWNLFAVIGIVTVMIEVLRYVIIPLLVSLNTVTGGAV